MEAVDEGSVGTTAGLGNVFKECVAMALVFFALQFTILALGPGDAGAGDSAAWNSLLANTVATCGVVFVGWLVSADRFFTSGLAGIGVVRLPVRGFCICLLAGALLGFVVLVSMPLFETGREPNPLLGQVYLEGSLPMLVAWIASLIVVAPIGEELVCRGFILPALAGKTGTAVAVVGAAFMFLLPHMSQIDGEWGAAASIFSLGVLAGIARVRTGSLFGAITVHASYNAAILAYMLWIRFVA